MTRHAGPPSPSVVISNHALRSSGGIERYLLTLLPELHSRGVRPTVVAKMVDRQLSEAAMADCMVVSVRLIPGKLRDLYFDWQLRRLKRRHGWFPLIALNQTAAADIAIAGSNHPGYLAALRLPARWSDRRKIALEQAHLRNARIVIAHSELIARQITQHYDIPRHKIEVIYPPVDATRFHTVSAADRQALRARLGLPKDRMTVLLASTGHTRKGLDLAATAVAANPTPTTLVVAGRPPSVSGPHIRYIGYRTDMEDVYRAVDATLLTSRYEPFGLVGVESVLSGTPVLLADSIGCAEVIRPPAARPFSLETPDGLAAALSAASQRWQDGTLAVTEPKASLTYDPSVARHVDALLQWVERVGTQA